MKIYSAKYNVNVTEENTMRIRERMSQKFDYEVALNKEMSVADIASVIDKWIDSLEGPPFLSATRFTVESAPKGNSDYYIPFNTYTSESVAMGIATKLKNEGRKVRVYREVESWDRSRLKGRINNLISNLDNDVFTEGDINYLIKDFLKGEDWGFKEDTELILDNWR